MDLWRIKTLISHIWSFLNPNDYVRGVCRDWENYVRAYGIVDVPEDCAYEKLERFVMDVRDGCVKVQLLILYCKEYEHITYCKMLQHLDFAQEVLIICMDIRKEYVDVLLDLKCAVKLCVISSESVNENIGRLSDMTNLIELDIYCDNLENEGIKPLGKSKSLQMLDLNCPLVTNEGLCDMVDLRELSIEGANIEGSCLAQMTGLEKLTMRDCGLTDEGVLNITGLKFLRKLDLSLCKLSREGLEALGTLVKLRKLVISSCYDFGREEGRLACLKNLVRLEELDLSGCNVLGKEVGELGNLRNLKNLSLEGCKMIGFEAVSVIAKFEMLTILNVMGCDGIMSDGFMVLGRLKISVLRCDLCIGEDAFVELVANHYEGLRLLFIGNRFKLTDQRVQGLGKCVSLRKVFFSECEGDLVGVGCVKGAQIEWSDRGRCVVEFMGR